MLYVGSLPDLLVNLISLPEQEMEEHLRRANTITQIQEGLSLKTIQIPFTNSMLGKISVLQNNVQKALSAVMLRIHILNQEIELSKVYFEKTFDELTPQKHQTIVNNYDSSMQNVKKIMLEACDQISELQIKLNSK